MEISDIIVSVISLFGTLLGTLGGIAVSSRLTNYRIEQLEKRVEKHNSVIERTYRLEERTELLEERVKLISGKQKGTD